ncbi:putative membrane protein [Mycolicibacterium hassiacum DSM 44199]|jgi:hypothetical protein|uniref:Putative membrane protein n=1 Tax=Mycolicibacterium hassiacum (strain DSM 44199 / CIP 105218 / JCM 12690 / 3849) TaxID=1122247 RepID=K5BH31_MYCHD|nr:hypothetical protein [Mycolicibacterium hassiacum]EKF25302.1 putative membrane protein [Mycolicibacterium hassiacum DSM 44199]MBX5488795.1 hypothetical protein [Mycolicibacterium hassiacum]MDA4087993.1 membrane protein [Mycolicibacterium hassiacum DSM 44199]VCT88364.1 hypothetical protein MHAS_00044 [Mycolicibacterium hassiacum DSM 44199]
MTAFWIVLAVGVIVTIAYVALAVESFVRIRRELLAPSATGEAAGDLEVAPLDDEPVRFTWKALGALGASIAVIALLGVASPFWYIPAALAIGSAIAVVCAFLIDRRNA